MSNKLLNAEEFGTRLYNTLPPIYRSDDSSVNYALKRYLEALSSGGFAKVIEEINGLLTLVDVDKIKKELLPILFKNYGMDIFYGIPENYLRNLLPVIGYLYQRKGTKDVLKYLTSTVSGVKTTITDHGNHNIDLKLEMDWSPDNLGVPDKDQLLRIVNEFVPFFINVTIFYVYFFAEKAYLDQREQDLMVVNKYDSEETDISVGDFIDKVIHINFFVDEQGILDMIGDLEDKVTYTNGEFALVVAPKESVVSKVGLVLETNATFSFCKFGSAIFGNNEVEYTDLPY